MGRIRLQIILEGYKSIFYAYTIEDLKLDHIKLKLYGRQPKIRICDFLYLITIRRSLSSWIMTL